MLDVVCCHNVLLVILPICYAYQQVSYMPMENNNLVQFCQSQKPFGTTSDKQLDFNENVSKKIKYNKICTKLIDTIALSLVLI